MAERCRAEPEEARLDYTLGGALLPLGLLPCPVVMVRLLPTAPLASMVALPTLRVVVAVAVAQTMPGPDTRAALAGSRLAVAAVVALRQLPVVVGWVEMAETVGSL